MSGRRPNGTNDSGQVYEEEYEDEDDPPAHHDDNQSSGGSDVATMQMSPLDLRFSQKKMRNLFADGMLVEDSVAMVKAVRRTPSEEDIYGARWRLEAPFPPIEVLRWRCKLRDETTGRPLVDNKGRDLYEDEESWFTLDNRRLYCLQRAALQLLPDRCTADAVAEIRKDRRLREIRKFRTLDSGKSIMVGSIVDGVPFKRWCWRTELARGPEKPKSGKGGDKSGGMNGAHTGGKINGYHNGTESETITWDSYGNGYSKGGRGKGKSKGGDEFNQRKGKSSKGGGRGGRKGGRGRGYKGGKVAPEEHK